MEPKRKKLPTIDKEIALDFQDFVASANEQDDLDLILDYGLEDPYNDDDGGFDPSIG